jgi:hypothetical protein
MSKNNSITFLSKELDGMLTMNQTLIDNAQNYLNMTEGDPIYTEAGLREHFKGMSEEFIQDKLKYSKNIINAKRDSLKGLYKVRDDLEKQRTFYKI